MVWFLHSSGRKDNARRTATDRSRSFRPMLQQLEDRQLMSTMPFGQVLGGSAVTVMLKHTPTTPAYTTTLPPVPGTSTNGSAIVVVIQKTGSGQTGTAATPAIVTPPGQGGPSHATTLPPVPGTIANGSPVVVVVQKNASGQPAPGPSGHGTTIITPHGIGTPIPVKAPSHSHGH
jgi:hypothetical protein